MKKHGIFFGLTALLLTACGGAEEGTEKVVEEVVVAEECMYSYNPEETVLTWKAFKLTKRAAVSGTFDEINVTTAGESEDMFGALVGATFEIPINSLNSQDEVRDPKIKNSFFGVMNETEFITGSVDALSDKEGTVSIKMNGITIQYPGEVKVDEEYITLLTTINITDFDGQPSLDSLGVVCEAKHTGDDGVNKLWSDVEIAVKTKLNKTCE